MINIFKKNLIIPYFFLIWIILVQINCADNEIIDNNSNTLDVDYHRVFMGDGSKVHDGDSIKDVKVIIFESKTHEMNRKLFHNIEMIDNQIVLTTDLRLNGIDTPEIRVSTKISDHCREYEKRLGYQARDRVKELIGTEFFIKVTGNSKYGEELVDIFVKGNDKFINVNQLLIDEKLAVPYNGGTKSYDWCDHKKGD